MMMKTITWVFITIALYELSKSIVRYNLYKSDEVETMEDNI